MKHKQLTIKDFKFNDDSMIFTGYASTFGNIDSYGDTVFKGAYTETIQNRTRSIKMRWNHYGDVIGKWLSFAEDDHGLKVEGEFTPNHSKASDVYASLKHGAIDGLSIGYEEIKSEKNDHGGVDLKEIHLHEISVVEEPADIHATVSDIKSLESIKKIERYMREVCNLSQGQAKHLISQIKFCQREVDNISEVLPSILELYTARNL